MNKLHLGLVSVCSIDFAVVLCFSNRVLWFVFRLLVQGLLSLLSLIPCGWIQDTLNPVYVGSH